MPALMIQPSGAALALPSAGVSRPAPANLFAWRARDPAQLLRVRDPIGPDNDHWLQRLAEGADLVLAAWGTKGDWLNRAESVRARLGPGIASG